MKNDAQAVCKSLLPRPKSWRWQKVSVSRGPDDDRIIELELQVVGSLEQVAGACFFKNGRVMVYWWSWPASGVAAYRREFLLREPDSIERLKKLVEQVVDRFLAYKS